MKLFRWLTRRRPPPRLIHVESSAVVRYLRQSGVAIVVVVQRRPKR